MSRSSPFSNEERRLDDRLRRRCFCLRVEYPIRMSETVNSVVVGDPTFFKVERSDGEPQLVFVKALREKPAESNLLTSTTRGREATLLLVSRGGTESKRPRKCGPSAQLQARQRLPNRAGLPFGAGSENCGDRIARSDCHPRSSSDSKRRRCGYGCQASVLDHTRPTRRPRTDGVR